MALELASGSIAPGPTVNPSGIGPTDFSGNSDVALSFDMVGLGDEQGVWLKQELHADVGSDSLASFVLQIRGDLQ
jgi:hypothetical protein